MTLQISKRTFKYLVSKFISLIMYLEKFANDHDEMIEFINSKAFDYDVNAEINHKKIFGDTKTLKPNFWINPKM
jgi:hypothetical protein